LWAKFVQACQPVGNAVIITVEIDDIRIIKGCPN